MFLIVAITFALVSGDGWNCGLGWHFGPNSDGTWGFHKHFRRRNGDADECPAGGADPHFRMISGERFSYHGQCDLVYMSCPNFYSDMGMDIHIRTKIKKQYSYIQGIALKFGKNHFEMDASDIFLVNGRTYKKTPPEEFAGYLLKKIDYEDWCGNKCANARIWLIRFDNGTWVELANWAGFLHIQLSGDFGGCTGMMGSVEKVGKLARNGTLIEESNDFGAEWRVQTSDPALFQYPKYDPCILPPKTFRRLSKRESAMALAECQHLSGTNRDTCIFDVEQTGNPLMAYSPLFSRK